MVALPFVELNHYQAGLLLNYFSKVGFEARETEKSVITLSVTWDCVKVL